LHADFNQFRTGPTQRSEDCWRATILGRRAQNTGFMLLEKAGQVIGYYRGVDGQIDELAWRGAPHDVLGFLLHRWPGADLVLPLCDSEVLSCLRDVAAIPGQNECHENGGSVRLQETDRGLWRYHADPECLFPEFGDTEGLLRFLRSNDYVMWPLDKA
jgi:hypothetical protein